MDESQSSKQAHKQNDTEDARTAWANYHGWALFAGEGFTCEEIKKYRTLELQTLCALSVSLRPEVADPVWIERKAIPRFKREALDPRDINEFLRRFEQAKSALVSEAGDPAGVTIPLADSVIEERALPVRVSDFVAFAMHEGWDLPPGWSDLASSGPAAAGKKTKDQASGQQQGMLGTIDPRQKDTYLKAIGALLHLMLWRSEGGGNAYQFSSRQEIKDQIGIHFDGIRGLSLRTLDGLFKEAAETLEKAKPPQ